MMAKGGRKGEKNTEIVRLHNRSKRDYILRNGATHRGGTSIDVPQWVADFHVGHYPADFCLYDDMATPMSTRGKLKDMVAENKRLVAENEKLKARLSEFLNSANEAAEAGGDTDGNGAD